MVQKTRKELEEEILDLRKDIAYLINDTTTFEKRQMIINKYYFIKSEAQTIMMGSPMILKISEETHDTNIADTITKLVMAELKLANSKFPQFSSAMEGWAVLKEEIEEVKEELEDIIDNHDNMWWKGIRLNNEDALSEHTEEIRLISNKLIEEAIQVAAMALKMKDYLTRKQHG